MFKRVSLFVAMLMTAFMAADEVRAQSGMSINTTGAAANASAMLDVSSTTKGLLAPRMTSAQRTAISSPATGLLVYQTDAPAGFYVYTGTAWVQLLSSSSSAGGDLTGSYPNPTIAATAAAGKDIVTAINADTDVIHTTNLGRGTASSTTFLRGDGTWNTPSSSSPSKYLVELGSGQTQLRLTTTSTGNTDSVNVVGNGTGGNQLVNINGGTYIDPSNTFPMVAVPIPFAGTVNSFTFFFRVTTPTMILLVGTYTFTAQLYYSAPPLYNLIGGEQFFPVTGATVSINLNTASGGILVQGETLTAIVSGLSFPLAAEDRLLILVSYNVSTSPFTLQTLAGNVSASVGMQ